MLVIIADDLTGALDTAAPFASRGLRTQVVLGAGAVAEGLAHAPDVLAINLASREVSAQEVCRLMRQAVEALPFGISRFKKVDSRLKGHIAAELDGIDFSRALVAPAIPAFGRIVRDGHVEGFGVSKPLSVVEALGHHASRCDVVDAVTDEDLLQAVHASQLQAVDLWVGARGLAEALAIKMTGQQSADLVEPPSGPALFVIGSHDQITVEQADRLRATKEALYLPAPNGIRATKGWEPAPLVLLQAIAGDFDMPPDQVARNLALSAHPALTEAAQTLLLSGGATAEALLSYMGIECFELQGECLPGLGLAYAGGKCIIAKSGGFGGADTLVTLAKKLLRPEDE